jgi:hypothetical protein
LDHDLELLPDVLGVFRVLLLESKHTRASADINAELHAIHGSKKCAHAGVHDRGYEDGHDLEDWLRAEAEAFGKKPAAAEPADIVGEIMADVA